MKNLLILIFLAVAQNTDKTKTTPFFVSKNIKTTIFSEAPVENIAATSSTGVSILNTVTNEIQFNIPIRSFDFEKKLMQEHFNENYMESDKYPNARFKGKINEDIDFTSNGNYNVSATGDLEVHGVKKQRTINGSIKIADNTLILNSIFEVRCADHNIKIPKLVFRNIAETIRVTVSGAFKPHTQS